LFAVLSRDGPATEKPFEAGAHLLARRRVPCWSRSKTFRVSPVLGNDLAGETHGVIRERSVVVPGWRTSSVLGLRAGAGVTSLAGGNWGFSATSCGRNTSFRSDDFLPRFGANATAGPPATPFLTARFSLRGCLSRRLRPRARRPGVGPRAGKTCSGAQLSAAIAQRNVSLRRSGIPPLLLAYAAGLRCGVRLLDGDASRRLLSVFGRQSDTFVGTRKWSRLRVGGAITSRPGFYPSGAISGSPAHSGVREEKVGSLLMKPRASASPPILRRTRLGRPLWGAGGAGVRLKAGPSQNPWLTR